MESQSECGSVTRWIRELKTGDQNALSKLWERYFPTIARSAKFRFGSNPRVVRDEEDIALSVLGVLLKQATLVDVNDREGLFRLLMVITKHKVLSEKRVQKADSRGGGRVAIISELHGELKHYVDNLTTVAPSPESLASASEHYQILLNVLPNDMYREIVKLRLMGKSIDEISDHFDVVPRTINRKLKIIQNLWLETLGDSGVDELGNSQLQNGDNV